MVNRNFDFGSMIHYLFDDLLEVRVWVFGGVGYAPVSQSRGNPNDLQGRRAAGRQVRAPRYSRRLCLPKLVHHVLF